MGKRLVQLFALRQGIQLWVYIAITKLRTYRAMPEVKGRVITIFLDHPFGEFNDSKDFEQTTPMTRPHWRDLPALVFRSVVN